MVKEHRVWDAYAFTYNRIVKNSVSHQLQYQDVLNFANINNNETVLDAGCGTGDFVKYLSSKKPNINIKAIDFSNSMIKKARKKCWKYHKVEIERANFKKTKYQDNSFHKVFCINALFSVQGTEQALREFYRIIKPGGMLIISDPRPDSKISNVLKEYLKSLRGGSKKTSIVNHFKVLLVSPFILMILTFSVLILLLEKKGKYRFYTEKELKKILTESGFTNIVIGRTFAGQNWLLRAKREG